jgi:hypothetical protein
MAATKIYGLTQRRVLFGDNFADHFMVAIGATIEGV